MRIHADTSAHEAAAALDAAAFTIGSNIVLGRAWQGSRADTRRALLAHELAHVVQQSDKPRFDLGWLSLSSEGDGSEQAADSAAHAALHSDTSDGSIALQIRDNLRRSAPRHGTVQRVASWAGDWTTDKYDTVKDAAGKVDVGVDIVLRFKPGKHVDATSIAMTQMATSKDLGKVIAVNKTVGARSIAAGASGEGGHIDQLQQFPNPLYATGAAKAGATVANTPTHAAWGQHGFRFTDKTGKLRKRDALLKDTPQLPGRGANASQVFESTSLAVSGIQRGTYYGSVSWGWQTNAAGAFSKQPLALVSKDVPTSTFSDAAALWNVKPTSTGAATMPLGVAIGKFTSVPGARFVSNPGNAKATLIGKLAKNTRLEVTDKAAAKPFNKDPATRWWKVTIVGGTFIGRVGWVMEKLLSDTKT